jgi:hypothetical protein
MEFCNGFSDLQQFRASEFDQLPTFCAVQVVVLGISIVMLINAATVQFKPIQQTSIDELSQGSIDSWPRDIVRGTFGRELFHELIGVKMLVPIKYLLNKEFSLFRIAEAFTLQILFKTLKWSHRNRNGLERFWSLAAFGSHRIRCDLLFWPMSYLSIYRMPWG